MQNVMFRNRDCPKGHQVSLLVIRTDDIPKVVQWYAKFYAGDNYTLRVNNVWQKLDDKGELLGGKILWTTNE